MNRSDFTPHTPFTAATRATSPTVSNVSATRPVLPAAFTTPATPARGAMPAAATQQATFRQVHAEVARYIASSAAPSVDAPAGASTLNPDGAALRARLAARAIGGSGAAAAEGGISDAAQQAFLDAIRPHAEAVAARLGVAPELVAAHAALESGWGRHAPANNLFGIKAGGNWQGAVQALATLEVEQGVPVTRTERFRGYDDMAGSFDDYAGLLLDNPRYKRALNTGGDAQAFARALQEGGYATDPAYADKLGRVAASIKATQLARLSQPQ
ncbi:MAG: flgJ [Pseudoduganella sp.]|jgi:flagellar protein FlgJ|nr:flgJ [Pseudoduganella sp.]